MKETIVTICCIDGVVQTRRSTLLTLQSDLLSVQRPVVGRSVESVQNAVNAVRDAEDTISESVMETYRVLVGTELVVGVNVGGTVFHVRLAVLLRLPYFAALLRAHSTPQVRGVADATMHFVDRDPARFSKVLEFVERYDCALPPKQEVDFYGINTDEAVCFTCRDKPSVTDVDGSACPLGHVSCMTCHYKSPGLCPVCNTGLCDVKTTDEPLLSSAADPVCVHQGYTNGLLALVATGRQNQIINRSSDTASTSIYTQPYQRYAQTSFTFDSYDFTRRGDKWQLEILRRCDYIGTTFLHVELDSVVQPLTQLALGKLLTEWQAFYW